MTLPSHPPERRPTVRASADAKTLAGADPGPPLAPLPPDAGPPGTPFGRYRLVESLGEGSMGLVWKAWDTELKRLVALKQIRSDGAVSRRMLERFLREARIAAKLRHPGIVAVHDVGEADGKHFLTMDYIVGRTLEARLTETRAARLAGAPEARTGLAAEIALLADVADAVAHAHAHGVVHRDLKPGNVLIDAAGAAYVMDFGIAKEIVAEESGEPRERRGTLTLAGQLLGTPGYMSPEQARGDGEAVNARADVWALGVILYELLTGETPFERAGGSMDILAAVIRQEPVPPSRRVRGLPAELEAVCRKSLEKDATRRFASAGEFAAELRRWLRGDPVETRPPTLTQLLWRRAVRHRAWLGAAAALLAAALAAGYFHWVAAREQAAARALRDEVLLHLRESAGVWLEEALFARRRGDLATARRFRPRLETDVRRVRERLSPPAAEPEFHLGRMLRAMLQDGPALAAQETALAIDPDFAPARYERAVLLARAYRTELDRARKAALARMGARLATAKRLGLAGLLGDTPVEPGAEELEREDAALLTARRRTLAALRELDGALARAPAWRDHPSPLLRVGEAQRDCAAGMLAAYGEATAWDAARERLEGAIARDPGLEEAHEALAHAATRAKRWEEAVAACTRGIEADRGYLPHWLHRGTARLQLGNQRDDRGGDGPEAWRAAEADFARAIELAPERADAWLGRARARANQAMALEARGTPADELYETAIADVGEALTREPGSAQAWEQRGSLRAHTAVHRAGRGQDARAGFEQAAADFATALEREPDRAGTWARRGALHVNWGNHLSERGEDPSVRFEAAIADLGKALELNPAHAVAWAHRGWARLSLATWGQRRGGGDAETLYPTAASDLAQALRLDPDSAETWFLLGAVHTNWASARLLAEGPAAELFAAAIEDYGKALAIHPTRAEAWKGRGAAHQNRALLLDDEDAVAAAAEYEAAERDLSKALELNPADSETWIARGLSRTALGLFRERGGQDPQDAWRGALEDFGRALAAHPRSGAAHRGRGSAQLYWGGWREARGELPVDLYEGALADFEASLEANPDQPEIRRWRDELAAVWVPQRRRVAAALLADAEALLRRSRWADARQRFEEGIAVLARAEPQPQDAATLQAAHYNLACIAAVAAAEAGARADAAAPAEAADLRDEAFRRLERALALGWRDRAHLETDPDLQALRGDARWGKLLEQIAGTGK